MKNFKGKLSVVIILVISIGLGFTTYVIVKDQKEVNEHTLAYLEEQGVDLEEDIQELDIVNVGEDEKKLAVVVIFVDEPDVDYFYTFDEDGNIYEFDRVEH
ncbi:MAG TPA: DUF3139 domain-containing protein [Bacillota bacterium]|nr:DUF3139 domain-containing protein [Bacillota bacterium]